jgi:magnesium transporter
MTTLRSEIRLQESVAEITRLLEKHRVLATMTQRQHGRRQNLLEQMQHRQNLVELNMRLRGMHSADIAHVLDALPPDDRLTVWQQVDGRQAGFVLVEVSESTRASLVDTLSEEDLVSVLTSLDPEDLGYIAESLPREVVAEVTRALDSPDRTTFESASSYPEDRVGRYMTRELVAVHEGQTIQQVLVDLRKRGELPAQTDRIFIVDARNLFRGTLALHELLLREPQTLVMGTSDEGAVTFMAEDKAADAARAFERYDLISAPVLDERGKLVGRLTVDAVMDFVRNESELRALQRAGLSGEEDVFARPWDSARNRWPWLAVNLITAFVASRVIGQFEGTIHRLAALAALMPIVASIGGNTGNQTMALVIRAIATDRIQRGQTGQLVWKELLVSLVNGVCWGLAIGLVAAALYASVALGAVMTGAVVLNLMVAATAGVVIPLGLHGTGRDPANGSSVLLTFVTDSMGFFLFLGLATAFLV